MTEEVTQAAPVEAPAQEVAPAPKWSPDVETEARALGWKAPDEWKGEIPSGYIDDPNRYLERAESFAPFRKLKEQNAEALRRIEAVAAKQIERDRAAHQAALDRIKAEKVAAVEVGDIDAYKALEKREEIVRSQAPDAPKPDAVPDNHRRAIEQWSVGKDWFKQDLVMTQAASVLYGQAQAEGLTDPQAILSRVDAEMAKRFAALAPKSAPVEAVEAGLTFGSASASSPFEKLPKDAKEAFRRFVEKGVFKDTKEDRAQYAEDYNAA
jgi:hypothetical protein